MNINNVLLFELNATINRVELIKNNSSDEYIKLLCDNVVPELKNLTNSVKILLEKHE